MRALIEQSMVWHTLIQMPLLVGSGWLLATVLFPVRFERWLAQINAYGLTGFLLSQFIFVYWMLPVAVDRALVMPTYDVYKLTSLLLCGAALQQSFKNSPIVVQLFFMGYFLPMAITLGLFMTTTDSRLCNAYSLESQRHAGIGMIVLSMTLVMVWIYAHRKVLLSSR